MFPLAAIGAGLNLIGGISGILGGNAAAKRARQAQDAAILDMQRAAEEDYAAALRGGLQGQYSLAGNLSSNLAAMGRGLGAGMAGAGVYNSSATAGALANQGAANAQTIGQYARDLTNTLANIRSRARGDAGRARLGLAQNDLNYAREMQAGGWSGIASALDTLGQIDWGAKSTAKSGAPPGNGQQNSVLPMPTQFQGTIVPGSQMVTQNYGLGLGDQRLKPKPLNVKWG